MSAIVEQMKSEIESLTKERDKFKAAYYSTTSGGREMNLPPLPPSTLYDTRQCSNGHTNDAMREYGQQCREAALEEAAKVCDERANGENDAQYCADRIRSLK